MVEKYDINGKLVETLPSFINGRWWRLLFKNIYWKFILQTLIIFFPILKLLFITPDLHIANHTTIYY